MKTLLQVEHLCAGYGWGDVIHDVSFSLEEGELCALLGGNGSGKTTLLRAVCTLLPSKGERSLEGQSLSALSRRERARRIGYLAQGGNMVLSLSVLDVVLMGLNPELGLLESPGASHRRRAMEALEWVGMAQLAQMPFQSLSQGQKQLCLFARTLVCQPELLVLDEPDSALDFSNRQHMMDLLLRYRDQAGRGVLLCSHDVNSALAHADRLLLMKDGTLIHDLRPEKLSREELERALREVYGPVEVLRHKGRYVMIGGERA